MEKIKWGVLGTADILARSAIGMQQAPSFEMYAIAGRSEEKVRKFKEIYGFEKGYLSYDELLDDPEIQAVYIPLPNHLHYEWVIKALNKKKHVLCEKPLTVCEEQSKMLYDIARDNGVYLMEAFAYQHSPYMDALTDEIAAGTIGDVLYVEAAFITSDYSLSNIRMRRETFGGSTYDLGVYGVSFIQRIFNEEPEHISAIAEFSDQNVDKMTTALLNYKSGKRAKVTAGMILATDQDQCYDFFTIIGTTGKIKCMNFAFNGAGDLRYQIVKDNGESSIKTVSVPNNYGLEMEQMSQCVLGNAVPAVTKEFTLAVARTIDRILASIGYK